MRHPGVLRRAPEGHHLWVGPEADPLVEAIIEGRYELNELDFVFRMISPGMHVVDVGAHVGAYTLPIAALVGSSGSVLAIEAVQAHAERLTQSVALNGMAGHVQVIHAAAAEVSGTRQIVTSAPGMAPSQAHLLTAASRPQAAYRLESVTSVTLDDCVTARPISFIRIDVEGAESLVLAGAIQLLHSDRPIVLAELHPHLMPRVADDTPAALIAQMKREGYECRLLGAGAPGIAIDDTPSNLPTSVVFLPRQR